MLEPAVIGSTDTSWSRDFGLWGHTRSKMSLVSIQFFFLGDLWRVFAMDLKLLDNLTVSHWTIPLVSHPPEPTNVKANWNGILLGCSWISNSCKEVAIRLRLGRLFFVIGVLCKWRNGFSPNFTPCSKSARRWEPLCSSPASNNLIKIHDSSYELEIDFVETLMAVPLYQLIKSIPCYANHRVDFAVFMATGCVLF